MRHLSLTMLLPTALAAQTIVSTVPQNRTGLLEEFTAINCPNCPQGHATAAGLLAAHPGQFIVVAVHGGFLSTPSTGQPDFRTTWGNQLWSHFAVNAQPLGLMNRTPHNGQMLIGRTNWSAALAANLAMPTPVNIGVATQFDPDTRALTVNVESYYTANGSGGNDRVHVLLTESGIVGFQAGGGSAYTHQHVLRAYLSPIWGDEITSNVQGTLDARTYTFTVPEAWDIGNCHVVAFVGEHQGQVHNAVEAPANGLPAGVGESGSTDAPRIFPQPATDLLLITLPGSEAVARWEILDLQGRFVAGAEQAAPNGAIGIDVSGLANGMHVIRVNGHAQRFMVAR